jgi:hypothetical protein
MKMLFLRTVLLASCVLVSTQSYARVVVFKNMGNTPTEACYRAKDEASLPGYTNSYGNVQGFSNCQCNQPSPNTMWVCAVEVQYQY